MATKHASKLCFACFLLAITWSMSVQSQPNPGGNGGENHQQPNTEKAVTAPNATIEAKKITANRSQKEEKANTNIDDGHARSPIGNFFRFIRENEGLFNVLSTFVIAIFTIILAVATVNLGYATQDLRDFAEQQAADMKESIAASKAAVVASEAAIKLAENTAKRQLRAYLGIVIPKDGPTNGLLPPVTPEVRLGFKNAGQTPAHEVTHLSGGDIRPYPMPKDNNFTISPPETPNSPVTALPGVLDPYGIAVIRSRPFTPEEIAKIQDGKTARFYVWGTLVYRDVFGDLHKTNYCFGFYNPLRISPTQITVQYDPCNIHNDSD